MKEKITNKKEMGQRIQVIRKHLGISQEELAEKTGYNQKTISNYENGNSNPKFEFIKKLTEISSCNIEWLSSGEGEPFIQSNADNHVLQEPGPVYQLNGPASEQEQAHELSGVQKVIEMVAVHNLFIKYPAALNYLQEMYERMKPHMDRDAFFGLRDFEAWLADIDKEESGKKQNS